MLVSLIIVSIFFMMTVLILNSTVNSYSVARTTLKSLYANDYVEGLFTELENEIRLAGSGSELLHKLYKPTFTPDQSNSYTQLGQLYNEFTSHTWIRNCIDYDTVTGTLFISYAILMPVVLKLNSDGTYSPLFDGRLDEVNWVIIKNVVSSTASGYQTRYAKVQLTKLSGPGTYPGQVTKSDKFQILEYNLSQQSKFVTLRTNGADSDKDNFIYPIARLKNAVFNNGYTTTSFRQVRISYDAEQGIVRMVRFLPNLDLPSNTVTIDLLNHVKDFKIYVLYNSGNSTLEKEISDAKKTLGFNPQSVIGLRFYVKWESTGPYQKPVSIEKSRIFMLNG